MSEPGEGHRPGDPDHAAGLWVFSDRHPDGRGYSLAVQYGPDQVFYVNAPSAYARHVIDTAVAAAHDAAILQQLTGPLGLPIEAAGATINHLRQDRRPPNEAASGPLAFAPLVSAKTGQPYVTLHERATGRPISQMTFADAIEHALHVLTAATAARHDTAYLQHLIGTDGSMPADSAAGAVGALTEYIADYGLIGYQAEDAERNAAIFGRWIGRDKTEPPALFDVPAPPPGSSRAKLVDALVATGAAPAWLVANAARGRYDDYLSDVALPQLQLIADLQRTPIPPAAVAALIERVKNGDFDGTKEESEAWAASPEGQEAFNELLRGLPQDPEQP